MRISYVFVSAFVGIGLGIGIAKIIYPQSPAQVCSEVKKEVSQTPAVSAEKNLPAPSGQLTSPEFHPTAPKILETNSQGEVYVRWVEAPMAKSYLILVEDSNGMIIRKQKTGRTFFYLRELTAPEGKSSTDYLISLISIGEDGQTTKPLEKRTLRVKAQSSVVAPQVQEIRVEN